MKGCTFAKKLSAEITGDSAVLRREFLHFLAWTSSQSRCGLVWLFMQRAKYSEETIGASHLITESFRQSAGCEVSPLWVKYRLEKGRTVKSSKFAGSS